jgi:translation initiation factor 1
MAKINLSGLGGLVFSTDPTVKLQEEEPDPGPQVAPNKQAIRIWLERIKGGKEATVIKGFQESDDRLNELAKMLKNKCASGGNAKDGLILVQGDHRDKVLKLLIELGYTNTKKAGS